MPIRPARARRRPRRHTVVAAALLATSLAACTEARFDESSEVTTTTSTLLGPDGIGDNGPGPIASGASPLAGMRGVVPGNRLPERFSAAVREVDPQLVDLAGAAEAYDIVMLLAIAAEGARSDAPGRIAAGLRSSTSGGKVCDDFRTCRRLALEDKDLDYDGVSGSTDLLANGDPAQAAYAVVQYDGTGALRSESTISGQAAALTEPAPEVDAGFGPTGDGTLQIGTLLPLGGPDAPAARAALVGARVAVDELNAGGGVIGNPVTLVPDESGDGSRDAVRAAVASVVGQRVDAVIGGTDYAVTSVALPELVDAGIVLFSPTDTSRALSVVEDRGLFLRLAPPTDLEGQVLGRLVIDDGASRVAIAAGTDADDLELAADVAAAVNGSGGEVTATVSMSPGGDADATARSLLASDPQAIVLVLPTASAASLTRVLAGLGKGPGVVPLYGTAANMNDDLVRAVGG